MKCLAVQQPWAWAICAGFKRIENRTWKTPYRGTVAIVASGKKTAGAKAVRDFRGDRLPPTTLVYGAVIGTAELTDVVPLSAAVEDDPHATGPYCWVFEKPRMFEMPITTSAKLRLYEPVPEEAQMIAEERAGAAMDISSPVFAAFARSLEEDAYGRRVAQADNYRCAGQIDDLERVTTKMFTLEPSRAEGFFCRAEVAIHRERDTDAIADYTRAITANPKFALAYLGRSDAYANLDNTAEADKDYARAIELNPRLADDGPPPDDEGE